MIGFGGVQHGVTDRARFGDREQAHRNGASSSGQVHSAEVTSTFEDGL